MLTSFQKAVLETVRAIPEGSTRSYGEVAAKAGYPNAARAVGSLMKHCPLPDVPCHRVIRSSGRLGGYGGHPLQKKKMLLAEGVSIHGSKVKKADDRSSHLASVASQRRR